MIQFTVQGNPVAQSRPRFNTKTGRAYDKAESVNFKAKISYFASKYMKDNDIKPYEATTPLAMDILVLRPIPASWSNKKKELARVGAILPTSKPDTSNYVKGIEDALNGICYADDSSIVKLVARKRYSDDVGVCITIDKYSLSIGMTR